MQLTEPTLDDIHTFTAFAEKYPSLLQGKTPEQRVKSLRWTVFQAEKNGLNEFEAIVGNNRKTRIVASRYLQWVLSQQRAA